MAEILPFIEQENLRNQMFTNPWWTGYFDFHNRPVATYRCPSDSVNTGQMPTNGDGALTSYVGITGSDATFAAQYNGPSNGVFRVSNSTNQNIRLTDILDGTSNTLAIGERPPPSDLYWGWWAASDYDSLLSLNQQYSFYGGCIFPGTFKPGRANGPCMGDSNHIWSFHTGGANFALADGSVRFLPYSAQPVTIPMGSVAGGEIANLP
jgi:prepilin-type processing-associated H-X9-DG protein